jgi:hypothetical protein
MCDDLLVDEDENDDETEHSEEDSEDEVDSSNESDKGIDMDENDDDEDDDSEWKLKDKDFNNLDDVRKLFFFTLTIYKTLDIFVTTRSMSQRTSTRRSSKTRTGIKFFATLVKMVVLSTCARLVTKAYTKNASSPNSRECRTGEASELI